MQPVVVQTPVVVQPTLPPPVIISAAVPRRAHPHDAMRGAVPARDVQRQALAQLFPRHERDHLTDADLFVILSAAALARAVAQQSA